MMVRRPEEEYRMTTQVFVLVPYDVAPADVLAFVDLALEPHRSDPDAPGRVHRRFDHLSGGSRRSFADPVAEGRLPSKMRGTLAGHICELAHLPPCVVPGALVTPDGAWHDLADFGWVMVPDDSIIAAVANRAAWDRWANRYRELLATNADCWVVEVFAKS
jgi:hypothetical protein